MQTKISITKIKQAIEDHWALQLGSYFSSVHDLNGATYNLGDTVTDYYWNYAGRIETTEKELNNVIERVLEFAKAHDREPAFYLDPSSRPSSVEKALRKRGFAAEDEEIWMFYPKSKKLLGQQPKIDGLKIQRVTSEKQFREFLSVFHEAYEMLEDGKTTSPYGDSLIAARKQPPKKVRITHLIGYVGGVPVSIASNYQVGKVAGMYNVGTPNKFRGKGYGAALSNAAIQEALDSGAHTLMLQTGLNSPAHRLYDRLGFKLGFTAVIWSKS